MGISSATATWLSLTAEVLAQTSTPSAGKGGTNGALPAAGTTELTYLLFIGGVILFVVGMLKLVSSYRE